MKHAIISNLNGNYHFRTFHLHLKEFVTSVFRRKLICKRFFFYQNNRVFFRKMNLVLKSCFSFYFLVISTTKYNAKEINTIVPETNILATIFAIIYYSRRKENLRRIFNVYDTFLLLSRLCLMMNTDESMNDKV